MTSTVPPKSQQPLHNFDLPNLKWKKDGYSIVRHHHRRRSVKSPSRMPTTSSASPVRQSPLRIQDSPIHGDYLTNRSPIRGESSKPSPIQEWMRQRSLVGGESERPPLFRAQAVQDSASRDLSSESEALTYHSRDLGFDSIRNGVYSSIAEQVKEKVRKKSRAPEVDSAGTNRSKIFIKIPYRNNKLDEENRQEEPPKIFNNGEDGENCEVREENGNINNSVDEETKTWNLRPRKPICKSQIVNLGAEKGNSSSRMPEKSKAPSPMMEAERSGEKEGDCNGGEKKTGGGGEKKEKRKLSISIALSKREIEEDIYSLTGSKPSRRPKKRAKNTQRELDFVFPGLWLVSITPDSYKVSENSLKG